MRSFQREENAIKSTKDCWFGWRKFWKLLLKDVREMSAIKQPQEPTLGCTRNSSLCQSECIWSAAQHTHDAWRTTTGIKTTLHRTACRRRGPSEKFKHHKFHLKPDEMPQSDYVTRNRNKSTLNFYCCFLALLNKWKQSKKQQPRNCDECVVGWIWLAGWLAGRAGKRNSDAVTESKIHDFITIQRWLHINAAARHSMHTSRSDRNGRDDWKRFANLTRITLDRLRNQTRSHYRVSCAC